MDLLLDRAAELEVLAHLVTSLGIGVALLGLAINRRSERWRRMTATIATVGRDYDELLRTSLAHPDMPLLDEPVMLATFGISPEDPRIADHRRRWILWNLAINDLEFAYLALRSGPRRLRRAQWQGWRTWFLDNLARAEFLGIWAATRDAFNADFRREIDEALEERGLGPTGSEAT